MVYARFRSFRELGSIESRVLATKFAEALDQEALEALRIARRLETTYSEEDMAPRLIRHRREKILTRLRKFGGLVSLVQLDALRDPIGNESADWYHQGLVLLDAGDSIRVQVSIYKGAAAMRPKNAQGTVAWGYLIQHQRQWGLSRNDLAALLARAGFVPDDPRSVTKLAGNIRKHSERRA